MNQNTQSGFTPLEAHEKNEPLTGFTIIEVMLVLSISSLLLVGMMTGITVAVQRQRFSDSVNGTQSFLQAQFNYTQNTVNNRSAAGCDPDNPGVFFAETSIRGASGCLVLGRILEIKESAGSNESTISAYDVIGEDVDTNTEPYLKYDELTLVRAIKPTAVKQENASGEYIVPWGAHITSIRDNDTKLGTKQVVYIALLRSPRSGVIHVYRIHSTASLAAGATRLSNNKSHNNIREIESGSIKMCLNSVDLINHTAMLQIEPTGSQDGITTHFDDSQKENYGC